MPPRPIETSLSQPESDVQHAQLVTLLSIGDFADLDLPKIVKDYLSAFCDPNGSGVQRRCIGITLARMLEKYDCVAHILRQSERLKNLGAMIMNREEQGVVKVIAGLIMRQGLEQNIEYHKFWPTEKFVKTPLRFPQHPDSGWIRNFHVFLESFSESTVADLNNKIYIGYIASIATSDGFARGGPGNEISAAILEKGMLTIIVSDKHLEDCHFVDIPVRHIISMRSELSRPHDVQTRMTGCESCSVILSLKSESWVYCLNSAQRTATEMSLVFKHSTDAVQWVDCIQQHQKSYEAHHCIYHSSVDTNSLLVRQDQPQKSPSSRCSHSSAEQPCLQKHTELRHELLPPKAYEQPRRTRSQKLLQEENTSTSLRSRRIECSKERQTRASRSAKQKALQKLASQSSNANGKGQKEGRQQTDSDAPGTTSSAKKKEVSEDTKSSNLHAGYPAKDDEEHAPTRKRPKKQVSAKRKVDLQLVKDGEQMKKSRIHSDSHADLTLTAKTERDRSRILIKPFSSALSSRHSLMERPNASQDLADSDASFKKPTLPAHNARSPSTPTRPKRKVTDTQRRLQTPRDPRSFYGDIFSQMPSSPPTPCQPDEGVGWSQETAAEAAILSSNSKPVPASPNAESTAISGHADSNDVAFEKQTGDSQIARNDPFTRRSKVGKLTSFLRRLTREEPADVASDLGTDDSQNMDFNASRLDTAATVIEPLSQLTSSQEKKTHPALACTQEIDVEVGVENDMINGDLRDDQQHSSESDFPPVYLSSSPPRLGSFTGYSSTSATPLSSSQPALLVSEAKETHCETSLVPCQHN